MSDGMYVLLAVAIICFTIYSIAKMAIEADAK